MATVLLTPEFILNGLTVPTGKTRVEYCDLHPEARGLYVEVNANNPRQGIYRVRLKVDGKSTHFVIGKTDSVTLQSARQQTVALKAQLAAGVNPKATLDRSKKADSLTLRDYFFGPYLERAKQTKKSWIRDVQTFKHIDAGYGDQKIACITLAMVNKQRTEQMNSGLYSAATVNHSTKLWRQLLRQSAVEGLRPPLLGIKLLPVQNMVENYLDDQQLGKLLSVLSTHENRSVCLIARWLLATGSRSGEARKAKTADIDRERRLWKIPAQNSKGGLAGSVFLNDSALEVLDQLDTQGTSEYLFVNKRTGKPFTTITKSWERIRTIAGLPHFRIHDLRHQHAVLLINSGRTLFEVATALRHRDPNTTTIRYAHLTSKTMQDVSNCADAGIRRAMAAAPAVAA